MSKQKLINIKILELNNELNNIKTKEGVMKKVYKIENEIEKSETSQKLQIKDYSDEDLKIVFESLKIHEMRIRDIENTISKMLSQINLLNRLRKEQFKFTFPITTDLDLMDLEARLVDQDFYDFFVSLPFNISLNNK